MSMTQTMKIEDTDKTIEAQVAEYVANGETPERARELADSEEAWMINHADERMRDQALPFRYVGNGTWVTRNVRTAAGYLPAVLDVIAGLWIEAIDFALYAPAE